MGDSVARKIRFLMETNHFTVPFVAEELGVTRATLQDVLDERREPTKALLDKIARYFSVPKHFFGEVVEAPAPAVPDPLDFGPVKPATSAKAGSSKTARRAALDLRGLATRYQALVELLVARGVFTAAEYRAQVEQVEER